jgi:hypothetical protein
MTSVPIGLHELKILAGQAKRNGTQDGFIDLVLEWCVKAEPEIEGLRASHAELLAAVKLFHDNTAEYQKINNLGGYDNHDMRMARAAIAEAEKA